MATVKDFIRIEDKRGIVKNLKKILNQFTKTTSWMEGSEKYKTDELFRAMHLIAKSTIDYTNITIDNISNHVSILALCTRNIYELYLIASHISESKENLKKWFAESIKDEIEIYEGILKLERENNDKDYIIHEEIERLTLLASKYNLQLKKISTTSSIAIELDEKNGYDSIFKLFSKLIHPTSYLVNNK